MRRAFACILPAALLAAAPARAEDPEPRAPAPPSTTTGATATTSPLVRLSLDLEYRREAGAARCMDEKHFRGEVARRLHRDPFDPDPSAIPSGRVTVVIARSPQRVELKYQWMLDSLELTHGIFKRIGPSCVGVLEWAADKLVEDINEMEADPPARAPAPASAPPSVTAPLPELLVSPLPAALPRPIAKPEPPPPPKRKVEVHGGVDAVFNPVVAPSVSVGFAPSVGVLLREPGVSIDFGLRAMSTVKQTVASNGEAYSWTYASGVLAVAIHKSFLFGGAVVEAGTLSAHSDQAMLRNQLAPGFVALGFQAGVERSFADLVTLHASILGEYIPVAAHLVDPVGTGRLLWAMPSLSATIAAGLTLHIW